MRLVYYTCHVLSFDEWSRDSLVQIQKALVVQQDGGKHVPLILSLLNNLLEPNHN